jgi:hypothetical protein
MAQTRGRHWSEEGSRFNQCKLDAARLLTQAASEWAEGDPSNPEPTEIVERILRIFQDEGLLRRTYGTGR